jgi:hypothetical protein
MNTVRESLHQQADDLHEEARMILPGVQALFGFQMVAVFNQRFTELSAPQQISHLLSIVAIVCAMGLLMTPAAYHRLRQPNSISVDFVQRSTKWIAMSLLPLALGVAVEMYVVASLIPAAARFAEVLGIVTVVGLVGLWIGMPMARQIVTRGE